jgi:hypothetical protein
MKFKHLGIIDTFEIEKTPNRRRKTVNRGSNIVLNRITCFTKCIPFNSLKFIMDKSIYVFGIWIF